MALEGPMGRGASCIVTSSFGAKGEGGQVDSQASWMPADTRSTKQFAGVPTIANCSSWSPSHVRQTALHLSSAISLSWTVDYILQESMNNNLMRHLKVLFWFRSLMVFWRAGVKKWDG